MILDTSKGAKLYAAENGTHYFYEADINKIEWGISNANQKPVREIDEYIGISTGEVSGDFVRVAWTHNSPVDSYWGISTTDQSESFVSWVLKSSVKNTTAEQDDASTLSGLTNTLNKTVTGAGGGNGGSGTSNNKLIMWVLGLVGIITIIIVVFKVTAKPAPAAPAATPAPATKPVGGLPKRKPRRR